MLYQKLLNRTADPSGLAYFTRQITVNGYEWVAQAIMNSLEYQQKYDTTKVPSGSRINCLVCKQNSFFLNKNFHSVLHD